MKKNAKKNPPKGSRKNAIKDLEIKPAKGGTDGTVRGGKFETKIHI